ncbi:hypothetical protein FD45_GL001882 [Liquorilactobacillus nagelii DSM 13675]|nr:hypothetical protein FD45_GL001882 [Liquorilactobacillus nagelii DSM 13675]
MVAALSVEFTQIFDFSRKWLTSVLNSLEGSKKCLKKLIIGNSYGRLLLVWFFGF